MQLKLIQSHEKRPIICLSPTTLFLGLFSPSHALITILASPLEQTPWIPQLHQPLHFPILPDYLMQSQYRITVSSSHTHLIQSFFRRRVPRS